MAKSEFWRFKDQSGGYYWIYYGKNGEEIARSSESYVRKDDCDHSVGLMRGCANAEYFAND